MISIVIPNKNKGISIEKTLDSLLQQSFLDWEALIVDDGSTDNSVQIIQKYAAKDTRFKLFILNHSVGGSEARNIGFKESQGQYIIFMDSDDLLAKDCLKKRYEFIEEHPTIDFAVFPMQNFRKSIQNRGRIWAPKPNQDHLKHFLQHRLPWQTMQPIWRRHLIDLVGGFDPELPRLQDVDFHTRILLLENPRYIIVNESSPDCFYRVIDRENDVTLDFMNRWAKGTSLFIEKTTNSIDQLTFKKRNTWLKSLRVTLLSTIGAIYHQKQIGTISLGECRILVSYLLGLLSNKNLFSLYGRYIVKLYCFLAKIGLQRIKGFNYIFRQLVKII